MGENIPIFLKEKLIEQYGENITKEIIDGYLSKRNTTLRANTIKSCNQEIKEILKKNNINYSNIEWSENAFILNDSSEEDVKKLNIYNEGKIYLQSLSSMMPAIVLNPCKQENILDMTAAPGGKTTQIVALSNNNAFVTACEKNKIRMERLKYNLEKQGATSVNVMNEDARKLDDFFSFDKILLDAPCSGSGTLDGNDINIEKYFSQELINRSVKTQKELLKKATKILKKGGILVYSTCSILSEENEENLKEYIKNGIFEIEPINEFEQVPKLPTKIKGTVCVKPTKLYEGFFVAKLKKCK